MFFVVLECCARARELLQGRRAGAAGAGVAELTRSAEGGRGSVVVPRTYRCASFPKYFLRVW